MSTFYVLHSSNRTKVLVDTSSARFLLAGFMPRRARYQMHIHRRQLVQGKRIEDSQVPSARQVSVANSNYGISCVHEDSESDIARKPY